MHDRDRVAAPREFVGILINDCIATDGSRRESREHEGDLHNSTPVLATGRLSGGAIRAGSVSPNSPALIVAAGADT
jgi:hypothetical protein